jgi:hypothetical protein
MGREHSNLLAPGTEIAAAVPDSQALDGRAAHRAGFTTPMSHTEVIMCRAQLPIRSNIGIDTGAFAVYGRLQDIDNRSVETSNFLW